MISDKTFTFEQFNEKVKEFAQALVNKIGDPGVSVDLVQESLGAYLITINKPGKGKEKYQIFLNSQGKVETISVYGE